MTYKSQEIDPSCSGATPTRAANIIISLGVHQPALERVRALLPPEAVIEIIPNTDQPVVIPAEKLKNKEILLCLSPPANFHDLIDLKLVQLCSVGYEQLYELSLPAKGIRACNGRGVFETGIAEWCIAMMINIVRDMPRMFRNQQQRVWNRDPRFQSEIRGATLGIYGYGGIGRETARLAKHLGLRIWVLTHGPIKRRVGIFRIPGVGDPDGVLPDRVFSHDQKLEFFAGLDYLLMAMPLTPKTKGIVGANELAALPKSAAILNPSRGPLIDERGLIDALCNGRIKGAALDTHYQYPLPPDHPLWAMENVILTPHISSSGGSTYFLERVWEIFAENVRRYLADEPLLNELTPEELRGET